MIPQEVRDLQVIVPEWMEKILSQAEQEGRQVAVTRMHASFGTYTMEIKIEDEQHEINS